MINKKTLTQQIEDELLEMQCTFYQYKDIVLYESLEHFPSYATRQHIEDYVINQFEKLGKFERTYAESQDKVQKLIKQLKKMIERSE